MRTMVIAIIIAIAALPARASAQINNEICYIRSLNPWSGWQCSPVLPVRVEPIGVEYARRGETISFGAVAATTGGNYLVMAPDGCIQMPVTRSRPTVAFAVRSPNALTIRANAPYLTCPLEVYRILPDREWGQPRQAAEVIGEVSGALGTAASLSTALRDWLSNQLVLWIIAILIGGWLAARVISAIIEVVTGGGDDDDDLVQAEAELYEHLVARGLDKSVASDIAGSWRDRLSDD